MFSTQWIFQITDLFWEICKFSIRIKNDFQVLLKKLSQTFIIYLSYALLQIYMAEILRILQNG